MKVHAPVSVVVPCYQCTVTIARAVASVWAQTVLPQKLILVDDGNDPATQAALGALVDAYPAGWIQLLTLDGNVGAASARNHGWNAAVGEWVAFLDADDAWHPQKIELQVAAMRAHPEAVISGHGHKVMDGSTQLPQWAVALADARRVSRWQVLLSNPFITPSVMVRRDVVERFTERQRYMEDHMLWLHFACRNAVILFLPMQLAAIYKSSFGVRGLSSQFWLMERGDLGNYRRLYRLGHIGAVLFVALCSYSVLKYIRRLGIYWTYLRWKN
jgi:glycosyltransferase involved in cell wall biosynthesis